MSTLISFFKFLFETLGQIVKIAPIELLVAFGGILLLGLFIFRKKIMAIPALALMLFFALLFVQVPNFIAQYQQSFAGALTGIEWSIDELNDMQIEDEVDNRRQVSRLAILHEKISKDVVLFQEANAVMIYPVFFTHLRKRVYERTLENYKPAILLNLSGLIAMAWGALLGFLVWRLISWPFRVLFGKRKPVAKKK